MTTPAATTPAANPPNPTPHHPTPTRRRTSIRAIRPRVPRRGPGRARLVAVEVSLGLLVAGLAADGPWRYALAGAGVALAVAALARRRGTWLDQWLWDRARRTALTVPPPPAPPSSPSPSASPASPASPSSSASSSSLGVAGTLLPALTVTEVADRNVPGLGVLADGRGHAAVAAFPGGMLPALPAGTVARWLADDPARPAAAQLVVEQFAPPPWDYQHRYQPTALYRQLPHGGRPTAVRAWLVVRYEPLDAPEAAARRGGGETGARAAVAAAMARLRARLAAQGAPTEVLGAAEARDLLRELGDADTDGRALPGLWAGGSAYHATLAARVASPQDWLRLHGGLASCAADRVVTAATLTPQPGRRSPTLEVRAAVRLVSGLAQHLAAERERLQAAAVTGPVLPDQAAGMLATLPLAHPARSLAEASGFAPAAAARPRPSLPTPTPTPTPKAAS